MKATVIMLAILLTWHVFFNDSRADQDLKANTTVSVIIGPFLDSTDGITAETSLTISQADVRLSKNGGTWAQKNNTSACSHMESGYYLCPLNTTDTNTMGNLSISVFETGALPVIQQFNVLSEIAFVEKYTRDSVKVYGTVTNAVTPTTTVFSTSLSEATADHYNGGFVVFVSGTLLGQRSSISDYSGTNGQITVNPNLTEAPANGDIFFIY